MPRLGRDVLRSDLATLLIPPMRQPSKLQAFFFVSLLGLSLGVALARAACVGERGEPEGGETSPGSPATTSAGKELQLPSPPTGGRQEAVLPSSVPTAAPDSAAADLSGVVAQRSGVVVADAACELLPGLMPSGFSTRAHAARVVASTRSAADGSFHLAIGPGYWSLRVTAPGFARWERTGLLAGDELAVRLDPTVQLSLSVVGPAGEPVPDAEAIVREAGEHAPENERCRLRTDPAGRAWSDELAPGAWFLSVRREGYGVAGVALDIPTGRFRVEQEVRLERGTRLVGRVLASSGAPLAGARVRIESPYRDTFLLVELATDADGRYASGALFSPQETLEVLASAAGHAEAARFIGIQAAEVAAGEAVLDFVLPDGGRTLVGRVTSGGASVADVSVRVATLDPLGSSAQSVLEALRAAPAEPYLWQEAGRTDAAGRFALTDLAEGPPYALLLVHESFAPRLVWVPPGAPGTTTELGELELERSGSLFGRAAFADGSSAEGVLLRLYRTERVQPTPEHGLASWRPNSWFPPRTARVREDGSFRFDALAPGTWMRLGDESARWQIEAGRASGPIEVVLPLPEAGERAALAGVVRSAEGGALASVFVRALALDAAGGARPVASELTGASGSFHLQARAGRVRVSATDLRGLHEPQELELELTPGTAPLELVLARRAQPLAAIDGLVLDADALPVDGCQVVLHPPEDAQCACIAFRAHSDAAGAFRFAEVTEGTSRVVASDPQRGETAQSAQPGDHLLMVLPRR